MRNLPGVLALLVACHGAQPRKQNVDAAALPEPTDATASVTVDAAPPMIHLAVAQFGKDGLVACMDLSYLASFTNDAGVTGDDAGATVLEQPCAESFADRNVLATCTKIVIGDAGAAVGDMVLSYYAASVLDDDSEMKSCLDMKAKWHAISREDPAYKRSLLNGHAKELQRTVKQMQGQQP
jgi:hypothetical protein